ncbi:hypothetical protein SVAN01_11327 [Stagonosporopsis vannaccii]|nr:hypothetical protein SVAN01_11327 [Stagonosporopsis vannaccii]
MTGFEDLDDDVLYLILGYLYLERADILRTFRLTSTRLKDFADAVAHRTVSLIDDESHEQITYRLAERLTDPLDRLCHYVRNLRVANFKGDTHSCCLNVALIAHCLRRIQRLDAFSWNCDTPIPSTLLHDLQQRFPRVQICANMRLTGQTLLSMPLFHRLDVSVPCARLLGDYSTSLFGSLKHALLQLPSLRHLCLDTHHDPNVSRLEGAALDRLQIPLESGDELPYLVSLDLRSKSYAFDVDHCKSLFASMDCSKLQSLTLGTTNPINFFTEFRQHLPHLSHLDISYASDRDDPRDVRLKACSEFVAGLTSLTSLVILAEKHGPSLHNLSLRTRQENIEGPLYRGNIRKFLFKFTALRSLSMDFPDLRSYHRCPDCEGYAWDVRNPQQASHIQKRIADSTPQDPDHFSFVPPLSSLRAIHLSIRAPFSEQLLYTHINAHAQCALCHLWTTFANRADSQLETLSIRFWRWKRMGRLTRLGEVMYESTRLGDRLEVRARHEKGVDRLIYREILRQWEGDSQRSGVVGFEA